MIHFPLSINIPLKDIGGAISTFIEYRILLKVIFGSIVT